jgi:hypothetical protein
MHAQKRLLSLLPAGNGGNGGRHTYPHFLECMLSVLEIVAEYKAGVSGSIHPLRIHKLFILGILFLIQRAETVSKL